MKIGLISIFPLTVRQIKDFNTKYNDLRRRKKLTVEIYIYNSKYYNQMNIKTSNRILHFFFL